MDTIVMKSNQQRNEDRKFIAMLTANNALGRLLRTPTIAYINWKQLIKKRKRVK